MTEVTVVAPASEAANEIAATHGEIIAAETIAAAEAAPVVAQIEADRDVAIAEIHAETDQAAVEAAAIVAAQVGENDEWRRNIETRLSETTIRLSGIADQVSSIQTTLTTLASPPVSRQEGGGGEVTPGNQEVPEPPAPRRKPYRWI